MWSYLRTQQSTAIRGLPPLLNSGSFLLALFGDPASRDAAELTGRDSPPPPSTQTPSHRGPAARAPAGPTHVEPERRGSRKGTPPAAAAACSRRPPGSGMSGSGAAKTAVLMSTAAVPARVAAEGGGGGGTVDGTNVQGVPAGVHADARRLPRGAPPLLPHLMLASMHCAFDCGAPNNGARGPVPWLGHSHCEFHSWQTPVLLGRYPRQPPVDMLLRFHVRVS